MSRIGRRPIKIPNDVKIALSGSGNEKRISITGNGGTLNQDINPNVSVDYNQEENVVTVKRNSNEKRVKALHGLTRALIANMVQGVSKGFSKNLEIIGLGYNAKVQGNTLVLALGYSHPVRMEIPEEIKVEVTNPTNPARLTISGINKHLVGQFSASIKTKKPPEPYKGMGIKYADETIRRKAGKALAKGK